MSDATRMIPVHQTKDVFVAGGTPRETYNPRQGIKVEREIQRYLSQPGKALTIYGASKSGKTVLAKKMIPVDDNIWLLGQDLTSVGDFWDQIAMQLEIRPETTETASEEITDGSSLGGSMKLPLFEATAQGTSSSRILHATTSSSRQHVADLVRKHLPATGRVVVIDDFHFIPDRAKSEVAKAIKTLIENTHIILIAVPSEAFDIVKNVPNMEGRLWALPIPPWTESDLAQIAHDGFPLLNIVDENAVTTRYLAANSFGSPFLMQQLCHDLARWEMDLVETRREPAPAPRPEHSGELLASLADRMAPSIFNKLLEGPNPKGTRRNSLALAASRDETDIYGALLLSLRNLIPPMQLLDRDIIAEVNRISTDDVVKSRVTNALKQIDSIAQSRRGDSDPVIRVRDERVFIQDSILAFYLKHGTWEASS